MVEVGNIPGFCAEVDTMRPGPTVFVFAEMDALTVPSHPDANPQTGAVHACVDAAKIQLIALRLFLENDAQKAKEAIASYNPYFKNKSEYFTYMNRIERDSDAVIYKEDGSILLNIGI